MLSQLGHKTIKRIKPAFLMLMLSSSCTWAQPCNEQYTCKVNVNFKGMYIENTCDLSINKGTANETVVLPVISTNTLDHGGAEAGSQVFDITLKNCPTDKTISLYFASSAAGADIVTGNLSNTKGDDYSQNVEVRLRNSVQQHMAINDANSAQRYDLSESGEATHQFIASYYAVGNTAVTPGLLSTIATIVVDYK